MVGALLVRGPCSVGHDLDFVAIEVVFVKRCVNTNQDKETYLILSVF